jgi:hypothetical protein
MLEWNRMTVFHISDVKKYTRCPRLFVYEQKAAPREYRPFVRLDEEVTAIAAKKLGVEKCFLGTRGDAPEKALEALKTEEWLVKARFVYHNLRVKVPFLHKMDDGWMLYFLFIGLYPHADDMQFYCDTVWVLENNGVKISDVRIIHLNAAYRRGKELDPDELFIISDAFYNGNNNPTMPALNEIRKKMKDPSHILDEMQKVKEEDLDPPVRTSRCAGRMKCRYYETCFPAEKEMPDNSILTLIASQHKYEMAEEGITRLKDADPERIEANRMQYAQIRADQNGGTYVDEMALKAWLERIHYPISFLDFEWERFAIPPYEGMRPYDVLPFEYSLHVMQEDGTVRHKVFLSKHDDRRAMAVSLISDIPAEGSVVAYNADGAEKLRIAEFAELFPEYREKLLHINARMEDLQLPFVCGIVYNTGMAGQWSLKKIMSIMHDKSYDDLDIHQGMDAVFAWRHLDHDEHPENEKKIIADLKKYCGMDSYAMTVVYQWLLKLVKENEGKW